MAARVALKPPVLSDLRTYLPWSALLAIVCAAALATVGMLAVRWPGVRHVAAAATAILLVGAWVRARPAYGHRRGWPPGSLGIARSFDAIGDRDFYRREAQSHGPVFKTSQFGRPVVCVFGLRLGREVLKSSNGLEGATLPYNRLVPRGSLRYMEAPVHDAEAPFFRRAFTGLDLAEHEDRARATCRSMLERLSRASHEREPGVSPRPELEAWVFTILASIFWGIGPEDPDLPVLAGAQKGLRLDRGGGPRWRRELRHSLDAVNRLARARAASDTPPDARSTVVGAMLDADPAALGNPSRAHNLALVFRLAQADLASLLDWVMAMLCDHPEWQPRVRAEPRSAGERIRPDALAHRIVQETLRLEQSEYLYREVTRPQTIGGYSVPAGWLLRVCVQESHRDPTIFADPDRFDPDRFLGAPPSRRTYSPFGVDDHGCMGVPMVHYLARVLVEEASHGYDARTTRHAPPEKGTRHRDHWRPGSARRIRLTPLSGSS